MPPAPAAAPAGPGHAGPSASPPAGGVPAAGDAQHAAWLASLGAKPVIPPDHAMERDPGPRGTLFFTLLVVELLLFGLLTLSDLAFYLYARVRPNDPFVQQVETAAQGDIHQALIQNALLILFGAGLLPALFVALSRRHPWEGFVAYFGLRRPGRNILVGLAVGVGLVVAASLVSALVLQAIAAISHQDLEAVARSQESPQTDAIIANSSVGLGVLLAVSAGIGEEVLFRGILQKRLGWWGQAIPFALMHYAYGTVSQILVPLALGLVFGYLVKRRGSLWIPIAAHTMFNLIGILGPKVVQ